MRGSSICKLAEEKERRRGNRLRSCTFTATENRKNFMKEKRQPSSQQIKSGPDVPTEFMSP